MDTRQATAAAGLDSERRLQWPPDSAEPPSRHDELCLQLATVRCEQSIAEVGQRRYCEGLLEETVELRSERRGLQEESKKCRRETADCRQSESRASTRFEKAHQYLFAELKEQQSKLREASSSLKGVSAEWVIEDQPQQKLQEEEAECDQAKESVSEWAEALAASEELAERLSKRLESLAAEVTHTRAFKSDGKSNSKMLTSQELESLRQEIRVLSARLALEQEECGDDARKIWFERDKELARLREAEDERKTLASRLGEARYDRDQLERSYHKVVSGLRTQQDAMDKDVHEFRTSLVVCRSEGEEMMSSMRENDESIAQMRRERFETEAFCETLGTQVARLEEERNLLRASVKDKPDFARGILNGVDSDVQATALALLDTADRATSEVRQQQVYQELSQDEQDAKVVEAEIRELDRNVDRAEARNSELRSEVGAFRLILPP